VIPNLYLAVELEAVRSVMDDPHFRAPVLARRLADRGKGRYLKAVSVEFPGLGFWHN